MIDDKVKNILIECLNENIKIEGMIIKYNLYEQSAGTGGTGGPVGSTGGPAGSTGGPAGSTGRGPTGGSKPIGPSNYKKPRVIPKAKPFIPNPMEELTYKALNAVSDAGELGVSLGMVNQFSDMFSRALEVTGLENSYLMQTIKKNLQNIVPNQEALRKEGMGYTKGPNKIV